MLNGDQPKRESKPAHNAATPGATSGTDASASQDRAVGSSGSATTADGGGLHQKHVEWIESRGIDPDLARKFGLKTMLRGGKNWLAVPYQHKGECVNHKYRLTSEKRHMMDSGAALTLWNADALQDKRCEGGEVIITEGEWDALTAIQCGFPLSLSVPNGAPNDLTPEPESAQRYAWVQAHLPELDRVKTFILATDADPAGYNLAADLAALLGPERCKFVEYPFPCKDLNEVYQEYGEARVAEVLSTAKPYPVKGLYTIDDFPERGEVRSYLPGIPAINDMIHIVPGTLTVATGYANMGKSTLMNAIIGHALRYHFPVLVASFETDVKPILRDGLRCSILKCSKNDLKNVEVSDADDILRSRLSIVAQTVDDDLAMDIDGFLEYCRIAVLRNGVKMVVLDPWNEVEHKRSPHETETDYISRALRSIKKFAKVHDVAFWVVAHPKKPESAGNYIPGLYDIAGSANWANKADYGIVYHRPDSEENRAEIRVSKVRMGLPGRKGSVFVKFDFRTSEFVEIEE